jgi:hypothetical protein
MIGLHSNQVVIKTVPAVKVWATLQALVVGQWALCSSIPTHQYPVQVHTHWHPGEELGTQANGALLAVGTTRDV